MYRIRKTIRIGADLDGNLSALAEEEGVTLNALVEAALGRLVVNRDDLPASPDEVYRWIIDSARRIDAGRRVRV